MTQKYQDEIEEILKQAGEIAPVRKGPGRKPSIWNLVLPYLQRALGGKARSVLLGRMMLAAAGLLVLALIFSRTVPGIGSLLAVVGVLLLIVGYSMVFMKPKKFEKRWRGRVVENEEPWWSRFRRKPR